MASVERKALWHLFPVGNRQHNRQTAVAKAIFSHKSFVSSKVSLSLNFQTRSTTKCFSPQSHSSSPKLWQRPCLWNVAPRKWWDPSPTPWCLAAIMEIFLSPANASMVVSTLNLALPVQCIALQKVCQIDRNIYTQGGYNCGASSESDFIQNYFL